MQTHTLKHFPLFGGDADFFFITKKAEKTREATRA